MRNKWLSCNLEDHKCTSVGVGQLVKYYLLCNHWPHQWVVQKLWKGKYVNLKAFSWREILWHDLLAGVQLWRDAISEVLGIIWLYISSEGIYKIDNLLSIKTFINHNHLLQRNCIFPLYLSWNIHKNSRTCIICSISPSPYNCQHMTLMSHHISFMSVLQWMFYMSQAGRQSPAIIGCFWKRTSLGHRSNPQAAQIPKHGKITEDAPAPCLVQSNAMYSPSFMWYECKSVLFLHTGQRILLLLQVCLYGCLSLKIK